MKLANLVFFWKKPKAIVVANDNQELVKKAIFRVLGNSLRFQREILITDRYKITGLTTGGYLILNYDDKNIRELKDKVSNKVLTFGFGEGADFRASDLKINGGINFKINYKENVIPVWLKKGEDKNQVYAVLATACVGTIFDLNLVEISQSLGDLPPLQPQS